MRDARHLGSIIALHRKKMDFQSVISGVSLDDMHLDFCSMCRLGSSSRGMHAEFHNIRNVYIVVPRKMLTFTLPHRIRAVTICCQRMQCFTRRTMTSWLNSMQANHTMQSCTMKCGELTKKQWVMLCRNTYRFINEHGELRLQLHIHVEGFKSHRQASCQLPHTLPWVAAKAHLLFYISSQIAVATPVVDITSEWILEQILSDSERIANT